MWKNKRIAILLQEKRLLVTLRECRAERFLFQKKKEKKKKERRGKISKLIE